MISFKNRQKKFLFLILISTGIIIILLLVNIFNQKGNIIDKPAIYLNEKYGFYLEIPTKLAKGLSVTEDGNTICFYYKTELTSHIPIGEIKAKEKLSSQKNNHSSSNTNQSKVILGENENYYFTFYYNSDYFSILDEMLIDCLFKTVQSFLVKIPENLSNKYKISLYYPADWKINPNYTDRIDGTSGYLQITAISSPTLSIDDIVNEDISHQLMPYGSSPKTSIVAIGGQEARLIYPSEDQPDSMQHQAGFIVKYPTSVYIGNIPYQYLMIWADKEHIEEIVNSITFIE